VSFIRIFFPLHRLSFLSLVRSTYLTRSLLFRIFPSPTSVFLCFLHS
jgi:hypothetical protein